MTILVFVLLGVLGVGIVVGALLLITASRTGGALTQALLTTRQRLTDVESSLAAAEAELASPPAGGTPAGDSPAGRTAAGDPAGGTAAGDPDRRVLEAMWQLQTLDLELNRRREAGLSTAAELDDGSVGLALAIQQEIQRVREEIGTPGAFRSDLDCEADPATAVLLLRSVQSTLDFAARRCQAFDLRLSRSDEALVVTVECDEFEGEPPGMAGGEGTARQDAACEAADIASAIAPAGGQLVFDRAADGRVRAQLTVRSE